MRDLIEKLLAEIDAAESNIVKSTLAEKLMTKVYSYAGSSDQIKALIKADIDKFLTAIENL